MTTTLTPAPSPRQPDTPPECLSPCQQGFWLLARAAQGNDFIRGAELSAQAQIVFIRMNAPAREVAKRALAAWNRAVGYLGSVAAGDDAYSAAYRQAGQLWVARCATFGWEVQPPVAVECEMPR